MEITIKINRRTKFGKYFYNLIKMTASTNDDVQIIDKPNKEKGLSKPKTESPYDPEFVKMVKKSAASKKRYVIDTDDVWGSLGLK